MILLLIGERRAFTRLVRAVDRWAGANPQAELFGQICEGYFRPRNFSVTSYFSSPFERDGMIRHARTIVCDASVENLLIAADLGKPTITLARSPLFGEARTHVQSQLAERAGVHPHIQVARNEDEVPKLLDKTVKGIRPAGASGKSAPARFIQRLSAIVQAEDRHEL